MSKSHAARGSGDKGATRELQALLDAAADAIVVIGSNGNIERFNRAAEQMFGHPAHELIGRNVNTLMPEPVRSEHDGYLKHHLATGESKIIGVGREVEAQRCDGSVFPAHLSVSRIAGGPPARFVAFIRDISERLAVERESAQAQDRLMQVARLSTMGEMAAGIAHEINQPLAAIATYSQACQRLLERGMPSDEGEIVDSLEQIGRQALRAGEVIRRLRTFVTNHEVQQEPIACDRLVEELVSLARPDLRARDVFLVTEVEPGLPDVMADGIQVQQVLINLLRNAIDATLEDSVMPRQVALCVVSVPEGVEFSVHDHGPGVQGVARDRLFSPFFTTKPHGTGLGLAISRTIVHAHGGKLDYRDEPGGGACFHFTLSATGGRHA